MRRIATVILLVAVLAILLSGCHMYRLEYEDDVTEYAMICHDGDLSQLDAYPNLEYVDLRGSTCYDAIFKFVNSHPGITVRYNISIGDRRIEPDVTELELNGSAADYDQLLQNLKFLPNLKALHLNNVTFTAQQLEELTAAYPEVSITYNVEICGKKYDHTTEFLDLPHMSADDVDGAIRGIALLPQLRQVNLVNPGGTVNLAVDDVAKLTAGCPDVVFRYEFKFFGQSISTLAEIIEFDTVQIGNEGIEELRRILSIMTQCKSVRLDDCGIDNELLAQLRSEFPEKNIAWRVFAGRFSMMTDEEMIRMNFSLTGDQAEVLKYCTNVKYMDISENKITNIDFAANMPKLECAVLTLTKISDLSHLSGCENLTWLEVSGCSEIRDLAPISALPNLKYLNVSYTQINDIDALDKLPLERFSCFKSSIKNGILEEFIRRHPDCLTTSKGSALDYGWRYNDRQLKEPFEYYAHMQEVFRYNDRKYKGNTKES